MNDKTLTLATQSQRTLSRLEITEELLDNLWQRQILTQAVEQCIQNLCFGGDPTRHADCREFWDDLPQERRLFDFFCLGAETHCPNCDTVLTSLVGLDREGRLRRATCPGCGETIESGGLERDRWWEALANQAGQIIGTFDQKSGQLVSGLIFRLARFLLRGGVIASECGVSGLVATQIRVYHQLLEHFPGRTAWCSQASRWVVYSESGCQTLGIDPDGLSTFAKCELVPVIVQATVQALNGQPVDRQATQTIWQLDKPIRERVSSLRAALGSPAILPSVATTERFAARLFSNQSAGPAYLVVKLKEADDAISLRERLWLDQREDSDWYKRLATLFETADEVD
jgi:hypothetical protein